VDFAVTQPAHFQVMYEPSLYRADDSAVAAGRVRAGDALYGAAGEYAPLASSADLGLAGWCLMHGLATLWLSGNLARARGTGGRPSDDPVELARRLARATFD
jgi:hypothetical protein